MKANNDLIIERMFEQYYAPMVLFAKNYVPDIEVCKDVVQEVFIALLESLENVEPVENYKAYLYHAVRNRCLKYIRHEQVEKKYVLCQEREEEEDACFDWMLEQEVYSLLMEEIANLPEQCRRVFTLSLEGKGNQEIADKLHVGIETVKSHKKTGKKILYARLKGIVSPSLLMFFLQL